MSPSFCSREIVVDSTHSSSGEDGRAEGLEDLMSRSVSEGRGAHPRDDSEWVKQNKDNQESDGGAAIVHTNAARCIPPA